MDIKTTYHFKVTWPFWTRFMLKPTVGMELGSGISAGTSEEGAHGGATQPKWTLSKQCRRLALREPEVDALDSKLAALDGSQSFRPRRGIVPVAHAVPERGGEGLTARTRSSEVLPAFCSPIMVMSISVALCSQQCIDRWSGAIWCLVDRKGSMGGSMGGSGRGVE